MGLFCKCQLSTGGKVAGAIGALRTGLPVCLDDVMQPVLLPGVVVNSHIVRGDPLPCFNGLFCGLRELPDVKFVRRDGFARVACPGIQFGRLPECFTPQRWVLMTMPDAFKFLSSW